MALRRRRVPGLAQTVGAPRLYERRRGRFGPAPGTGFGQPQPPRRRMRNYQQAQQQWRRRQPGGGPGGGGGGGGQPPGPYEGGGPYTPYLPPDPEFEMQQRGAEDALAAAMAAISGQRGQIEPARQMGLQRLATNQAEDTRQIAEGANARGIFGSGIQRVDTARSDLGFDRQRQDMALDFQRQLTELQNQESAAQLAYQQALMEAQLGLGARSEEFYNPLFEGGPPGPGPAAGGPRRNRRRGRGGPGPYLPNPPRRRRR